MKFNDKENITLNVGKYQKTFIYFLIENNDVVYVGQTSSGIKRPFQHLDKDFDTIKIIYCDIEELDRLENHFIKKYRPKYNKKINYNVDYSFQVVKNKLNDIYGINLYVNDIKKITKFFNIKVDKDIYTQRMTIYYQDFYKIQMIVEKIITHRILTNKSINNTYFRVDKKELERIKI